MVRRVMIKLRLTTIPRFYKKDQPEYAKMMKQHNWVNRHNEKVLNQKYYDVSGKWEPCGYFLPPSTNVINPFESDGKKSQANYNRW